MHENSHNPKDRIQDLLDGRLSKKEQAEVEAQIEQDPAYRREWEALRSTRDTLQTQTLEPRAPADLQARVMASLDAEDRKYAVKESATKPTFASIFFRPVFISTFALILIVSGAIFFTSSATSPVIAAVTSHYRMCINMDLSCHKLTHKCGELEKYYDRQHPSARQRVIRLDDMDYHLVGGCAHDIMERRGAFSVYKAEDGKVLACQMFVGALGELPSNKAQEVVRDGVTFKVCKDENLEMVFWQEDGMVCAMISPMSRDDLLKLAVAKARS